jgi:hypothetical protein
MSAAAAELEWRRLQPGVEYATSKLSIKVDVGDRMMHVVRIDPAVAQLHAGLASLAGSGKRTAAEWCRAETLAVAINLGMFGADQLSHVGYLRVDGHVDNGDWNEYRAAVGLKPTQPLLPPVRWLDLDPPYSVTAFKSYGIVVQNLRLIRLDRQNVWSASPRRWSEAALAIDGHGRLLFLFCRSPLQMSAFNRAVLALPIDARAAMHLEGGPEASLSIHAGGVDLDVCGSYETGFLEDDSNSVQWPIPNVLGVRRR